MLKMTIITLLLSLFYWSYLLSEGAGVPQSILGLGYGLDDLGFQSRQRKGNLSFSKPSRLGWGPILPHIPLLPGSFSGVKWLWCDDHSLPSNSQLQIEWSVCPYLLLWDGKIQICLVPFVHIW
jgi:hypothetical protein